jgi:hypothetical protein
MKKLFWIGFTGLLLFEIANVYFIMPMPGSQQANSIDLAYFLYKWRWVFRILFGLMIVAGFLKARLKRKWLLLIPVVIVAVVAYMANFKMAADHMFYQPKQLLMATADSNKVDSQRLVIGITQNNEAKAYPVQFIGYHHQVADTIGGKPVIVTYCTVCRTGRAFEPFVNGKYENFRLVGMDHFNAMFEDATTKSWWRQVNGEAIAGKLKGEHLPEVHTLQTSLGKWLQLYPQSLVMQPDPAFKAIYDSMSNYETGKSRGSLTKADSSSWKDKSWVIGVKNGKETKAYDWNMLKEKRIIHDQLNDQPVTIVLASDDKSFFALQRPAANDVIALQNDTLYFQGHKYRLDGKGIDTSYSLKLLPAYQEFWHSWRTFNPDTKK